MRPEDDFKVVGTFSLLSDGKEGWGETVEHWLDGWDVTLSWSIIDGRWECVGVCVNGSQPLTASLMRQLPLGGLILERRKQEAKNVGTTDAGERISARFDAPRKRYTDAEYQLVADAYDEAMRAGIPPTAHVQDKLRLRTRTQAGKLVARVRQAGLLPPTTQRIPKGNQ